MRCYIWLFPILLPLFLNSQSEIDSLKFKDKKLKFVLGGSFNTSVSDNPIVTDYWLNPIAIAPLNLNNQLTFITEAKYTNPVIYGGLIYKERFMFGARYEFGNAYNLVDYQNLFTSTTIYLLTRNSALKRIGLLSRYLYPIGNRLQVGFQVNMDRGIIDTRYEQTISSTGPTNFLLQEGNHEFWDFEGSANLIFEVSKRFNIIIQFGEIGYTIGSWKEEESTFEDGVLTGDVIERSGRASDYRINFNSNSIYLGFEVKI